MAGFERTSIAKSASRIICPTVCNVRWTDGDTQVELPTLRAIIGTPLPRAARVMLEENLDALIAAWNMLNAEQSI